MNAEVRCARLLGLLPPVVTLSFRPVFKPPALHASPAPSTVRRRWGGRRRCDAAGTPKPQRCSSPAASGGGGPPAGSFTLEEEKGPAASCPSPPPPERRPGRGDMWFHVPVSLHSPKQPLCASQRRQHQQGTAPPQTSEPWRQGTAPGFWGPVAPPLLSLPSRRHGGGVVASSSYPLCPPVAALCLLCPALPI